MGDMERLDELLPGTPEQAARQFKKLTPELQQEVREIKKRVSGELRLLSNTDSPEGFAAFFHQMEGVSLEDFAMEAVHEAYRAHSMGMGSLHEWFRESGKTTVFTKWFLLYRIAKKPEKTYMFIRINDDKANLTSGAIANIIEKHPLFKELFPYIEPEPSIGWGANGYNIRDLRVPTRKWHQIRAKMLPNPTFVGYGWKSGSVVGSRINGALIVDDIQDDKNTQSEREMSAVKKFVIEDLSPCIMLDAWEIWNYTPWTFNDIYSDLRVNKRRYIHNYVPAIKRAPEGRGEYWERDEDIPYSGKWWYLAAPKRFDFNRLSQKYLMRTDDADEYIANAFERQYLLDLEATKGYNLKGEWLHEFPAADIRTSWPVFFGIDYASTPDKLKHKQRDYFALAIMRAIPGGGIILIDGVRKHLTKPEALDLIISYASQYPTLSRIGVETIGTGEEFYTDLMMITDVTGKPLPLFSIKHGRRSKGERFEGWLAPRFKNSQIWIIDTPTSFIREFKNEWMLWPNAQHDDCIDGVYMAAQTAQYMMPSRAERTFGRKRKKSPYAALVGG